MGSTAGTTGGAVAEILADLRVRFAALNGHFEAGWSDSYCFRRCGHEHMTLIDAAKCAMPRGCGWYVFAVDLDTPRELTHAEDRIVDEFRFGKRPKDNARKFIGVW